MGRGITLSDGQWDETRSVAFYHPFGRTSFANCLIVLKSDSAETIPSIAEQTRLCSRDGQAGCDASTAKVVSRRCVPGHSPGRPSKGDARPFSKHYARP